MLKVISTEEHPIKMWLNDIEDGALEQAKNLANLPFIHKHVAIMPDSHQGYGMPIGGVIATSGVVIPNAVGVDIGCGMCAVKTNLTEIDTNKLKEIMSEIRKQIPVGFNHHKDPQDENLMPHIAPYVIDGVVEKEYNNARMSLGTLGGGNHFIEIQKGSDGYIWIMIHSGSRNLGKKVADYYNNVAKMMNTLWYSSVPKEHQLAFLPLCTEVGERYLKEMQYCVAFALANRKLMMRRIEQIFFDKTNCAIVNDGITLPDGMINIAHNYAIMEHHFNKDVMVHRKGATLARKGTIGIIPGSQGTSSYIVKGLGNSESFKSCSHGAGRKMSRTKARNELDLKKEIKKLDDKNIIHSIRHTNDLDEASGAYKDIDIVMENQKDLVEILVKLEPLAVIKG